MGESKHTNNLYKLRGTKSQKDMAKLLGLTQQSYSMYENGKQQLKSDLIEVVCNMFGCSAEWLLCMTDNDRRNGWVSVPLYGAIAAGTPIEMLEVDDMFDIPEQVHGKYPDAFLLRVIGDSMNRILPNGCYALIDPCKTAEHDGAPYAVCVNGYDATIKRVRKLNNGFELVPDSTDPTYESKIYNYNDEGTEKITIIGRVVYYVLPYDWTF